MKKLPLLLLLFAIVSCVYQPSYTPTCVSETPDVLSSITSQLVAIPLETNPQCQFTTIQQVKCVQQLVYVLANNDVYWFDRSGSFKGRLGYDKGVIDSFTVHPAAADVLVLNQAGELHQFSHANGAPECLGKKAVFEGDPSARMLQIEYLNNEYWLLAEHVHQQRFEKYLHRLNQTFHVLESQKITPFDIGRPYFDEGFACELAVVDETVYVYSPSCVAHWLVPDSMRLLANNPFDGHAVRAPLLTTHRPMPAYSLPFRLGSRYLFASYRPVFPQPWGYLYYYDQQKGCTLGARGFTDNLCHTGTIRQIGTVDLQSNHYFFTKNSASVARLFPQRTATDNPVLFLFHLETV